jgi:predicted thioredoxin/glutaredoxin
MMLNIPSITEIGSELLGRLHGPFSFRFVLQPLMAAFYAVRYGVKDAREGKPAYFWSVVAHPAERRELLREAWHHVLRVVMLGVVMEVLYEIIVFHAIRPLQLVVIVLGLAFVPYLLVRGPVNRIARRLIRRGTQRKKAA